MALKGKEDFVAKALQKYLILKHNNVSYSEGADPPDIYLNVDNKQISVEISELDENSLQGRKTVDRGFLAYIDNLDKTMQLLVPKEIRICIDFYHFNNKVSKINKKFKRYLEGIINKKKPKIGDDFEDCIDEICFKITMLKSRDGCRKITGSTTPFGMLHKKSRDISTVSKLMSEFQLDKKTKDILLDRILDKNEKCKHIKKPIWFALYDNYYNKFSDFECDGHKEHYKSIAADIDDYGIFEKVFVAFQNEDVIEIT